MFFSFFDIKTKTGQWLNIAIGILFTLFTLLVEISFMNVWRTFYVFLFFLESILTLIIVITV